MSKATTKILLVFSSHHEGEDTIYKQIQQYNQEIAKIKQSSQNELEYYLLYVGSQIPSYALQSPEMIQFAMDEVKHSEAILKNLGRILAIEPEKQFLMQGSTDLQAWQVAKQLEIDKVFGYSHWFQSLLNASHFIYEHMPHFHWHKQAKAS